MKEYKVGEYIELEVKEYDNNCEDCFFNNTNLVASCYEFCDFKRKFVEKGK